MAIVIVHLPCECAHALIENCLVQSLTWIKFRSDCPRARRAGAMSAASAANVGVA
jgi:hypothetical protein